ncbi:MAG: AAA family ATPase [Planctomycetota bacterium]|jgi:MoxR-like ATPase
MPAELSVEEVEAKAAEFRERYTRVRTEVEKVIVGHRSVIDGVLTGLFSGGHCLLEGVPGLGKTMLVRVLGKAVDLHFKRIQFTPDLMPADIIGTNLVVELEGGGRGFRFERGPVFTNLLLADEVNRATPKTQSALLEAMQEQSVTVGGTVHSLDEPFMVLATQNPIEMEGTYPLPEAQLDRFLFKLVVTTSSREELNEILKRTTEREEPVPERVLGAAEILEMKRFAKGVVLADHVRDLAVRFTLATHPGAESAPEQVKRFVRFGASPRSAQAIALAAKVFALVEGRIHVSFGDVRQAVLPAMRHRIILNFEAEAEGVDADTVLKEVVESVKDLEE